MLLYGPELRVWKSPRKKGTSPTFPLFLPCTQCCPFLYFGLFKNQTSTSLCIPNLHFIISHPPMTTPVVSIACNIFFLKFLLSFSKGSWIKYIGTKERDIFPQINSCVWVLLWAQNQGFPQKNMILKASLLLSFPVTWLQFLTWHIVKLKTFKNIEIMDYKVKSHVLVS